MAAGDLLGALAIAMLAIAGRVIGLAHCFHLVIANLQKSGVAAFLTAIARAGLPDPATAAERLAAVVVALLR
jgi:hypothetical protein